jgi:hypothetical protein
MAAQRETGDDVTLVIPVDQMTDGQLITHCRERHKNLGFITRNEHEAAHRLREHDDHLHENHVDEPPQPETQAIRADTAKKPEGRARRSPAR